MITLARKKGLSEATMHPGEQFLPDKYRQSLLRISQRIFAKTGESFFQALAQSLAIELNGDFASIGVLASGNSVQTVAFTNGLEVLENFSYPLAGTPCEDALDQASCIVADQLDRKYPDDHLLRSFQLQAYTGVRLFSSAGKSLGVLNVLFRRALAEEEADFAKFVLIIQGLRASSELERMATERALKQSIYFAAEGFEHSPLAMLILDLDLRATQCNKAFLDLTTRFREEVKGTDVTVHFTDGQASDIKNYFDQLLHRKATHFKLESVVRNRFNQDIPVQLDCYSLRRANGEVTNIIVQIENISSQKFAQRQMRKLSRSVELSPVATIIADQNAVIEYVNPRFLEMTGFSEHECVGKSTRINASGSTPLDVYQEMWNTIIAGKEWQGELLNRRKNGDTYWAKTIIFPILDDAEQITNFVSLQEDISEAKNLSVKLRYEATHDPLTGLINRREFTRRLQAAIEIAAIDKSTHALCFLDLDQFKIINDTSGHIAGDALLSKIGAILHRHVRSHDTAARVGGDEFALILSHCPLPKAQEIGEAIRSSITRLEFDWDGVAHRLGASIGITRIDSATPDVTELMKQVDMACYSAKDHGRNRVHVYQEDNRQVSRRRSETNWVPELNTALREQRFALHAQQIQPLSRDTQKPGYEILIRLIGRDGNLIMPGEFLPAAERYGLSALMDRCVFDRLYRWLVQNPALVGEAECFSINLSGASISNQELLEHLIDTVACGPIAPEKLHFEITETAAISDVDIARNFMQRLRLIGCQLVLDDFGRGLSSFAYLKNLPVDILKIDGHFIAEIMTDKTDFTMVRMINELAHSLGIRTVAECVENGEQLACVKGLGIDYAQGFGVARPVDLETLSAAD